ncbi:DDE-type integrase/transposase/recombinase [Solibacillus sp. FSL H8-0538]|uniref:DDE-type integrase/transposase/recombinase n=1 Tax=Solibacillus sp. FSL H8-0538 TaxID=2921400 RepID=UPI0030FC3DAB
MQLRLPNRFLLNCPLNGAQFKKFISRRRISRMMKQLSISSNYTVAYYKPQKKSSNEAIVANVLNREFHQEKELSVLVSDLTYVRVGKKWHYVCLFTDLFNRELVGASSGPNKDAALVYRALSSIKGNLTNVQLFHTDRGSEFDNQLMAEVTETFGIQRSLSAKGCPNDRHEQKPHLRVLKSNLCTNALSFPLNSWILNFGIM